MQHFIFVLATLLSGGFSLAQSSGSEVLDHMHNGFHVEGISKVSAVAFASSTKHQFNYHYDDPYYHIGVQFGHDWYFGNNPKLRPGISVLWVQAEFGHTAKAFEDYLPAVRPLQIGFSTVFATRSAFSVECKLTGGYGIAVTEGYGLHTLQFSPEIHLRMKRVKMLLGYEFCQGLRDDSDGYAFRIQMHSLRFGIGVWKVRK